MSDKLFLLHQKFKYQIVQFVAYVATAIVAIQGVHTGILTIIFFVAIMTYGISNYREGKRDAISHLGRKEFLHYAAAMLETAQKNGNKAISERVTYDVIDEPQQMEVIIRRPRGAVRPRKGDSRGK